MADQRSDNSFFIRERAKQLLGTETDWDGEITAITDVPAAPIVPVQAPRQDSIAEIDPKDLNIVTRNGIALLSVIPEGQRLFALALLLVAGGGGYWLYQLP